jgi:molecular chaperone DnaJ
MPKNYYVVLGITADASAEDVKAAFRRRALELHPDRSGKDRTPFQEAQEAYSVLADPERRRQYDGQRRASSARARPAPRSAEPMVQERGRAEPLRPVAPARALRELSLMQSFEMYRPSFDELFDRFWGNFAVLGRPKAEELESLTVEVGVSPEEAQDGGHVRVWLPTRAECTACGGHGAIGDYECWRCGGHGSLTAEYPVDVGYPPGIRDGYALRIPLARFGIQNFYLTVLFRVSAGWESP